MPCSITSAGLLGVPGVQVPGPVRAGLEEALAELHLPQVGPDAGERAGADRRLGHGRLLAVCAIFATLLCDK